MNAEDRLKQMMAAARAETSTTQAEWDEFARRAHRSLYARRVGAALGAVALVGVVAFAAIVLTSNPVEEPPIPPAKTESPEPSPTEEPEPTTVEVGPSEQELWFVQDERLSWGTTVMGGEVSADLAPADDPIALTAAFWLQQLLAGPTGPDVEAGASTAIPEGTQLLGVSRDLTVMTVDLSSEFTSGGGSLSMQLRVAQVVYTATQFEDVDSVRFLIDGEPVDAIGGEGVVTADPLERRDFENVAPFVVLEEPLPGQKFGSGYEVSGFANVFEANVNLRVVGEDGTVLVETFTTATCGTGCWGDFSEVLEFEVTSSQKGRVEALTFSAEDGSERDLVSISVVLVP